jgi:hypothetical protein
MSTKIGLEIPHLDFWYQYHGYDYPCTWEDIIFYLNEKGQEKFICSITVQSREYYAQILKAVEEDDDKFYTKLEIDYPGSLQEEKFAFPFKMQKEELIKKQEILFGFMYPDPLEPATKNDSLITLQNLPLQNDVEPDYIEGYIPENKITKENIIQFSKLFLEKYMGILDPEFYWIKPPAAKDVKESWEENQKLIQQSKEMRERGEKWQINMLPQVMEFLEGSTFREKYGESVEFGELLESKEILLHFKDGHTEILDTEKKEWH